MSVLDLFEGLDVPACAGRVLAEPPVADYGGRMQANRDAVASWRFSLAGLTPSVWRDLARQEMRAMASAATALMDEEAPRSALAESLPSEGQGTAEPRDGTDPFWPITGHQPALFHPGVWIKNFLLDAWCRRASTRGLNLIVDSDLPADRGILVPTWGASAAADVGSSIPAPRWRLARVPVPGLVRRIPWEAQPPLSEAGWRTLLDGVRTAQGTRGSSSPAGLALDIFELALRVRPRFVAAATTMGESLARARRLWEEHAGTGRRAYDELTISAMCSTRAFWCFVVAILERIREFHEAYNGSLSAYRTRHRFRTSAHPMPDLRHRDTLWEMPFWYLHPNGERRGLFAQQDAHGWTLMSKDTTLVSLDGDVAAWPERLYEAFVLHGEPVDAAARGGPVGATGVRPRALSLTLFARLAGDLFLHGVGGARYDQVTNGVMRTFWDIEPPAYAAASLTLWPDLRDRNSCWPCSSCVSGEAAVLRPQADAGAGAFTAGVPAADAARVLTQRLRELSWNPQRFLAFAEGSEDQVRALCERKATLVSAVAVAPRGTRRHLTAAIREVNEALAPYLKGHRDEVTRWLAEARVRAAECRVLTWRAFPFFMFLPSQLSALPSRSTAHSAPY